MSKTAKQILSLVLAMAMIAAYGVTVAFADTYSITIEDAHVGETYTAYHVFDVVSGTGTSVVYGISVDNPWYDIITTYDTDNLFTLSPYGSTGTVTYYTVTTSATEAQITAWFQSLGDTVLASAQVSGYYTSVEATAVTAGDTQVDLTIGVDSIGGAGYYFITTTAGASIVLDTLNPTQTITEKNVVPSVDKEVTSGTTGGTSENNTASVGDELTFTSTISNFYDATKLVLVDEMDNLEFGSITSVQIGFWNGTGYTTSDYTWSDLAAAASSTMSDTEDYYVETTADGFKITFNTESDTMTTAVLSTIIVVTYTATVTEDASYTDPATNETYVEYGDKSTSSKDKTTTTPLYFTLNKTDADNNTISGAKFQVYTTTGSEHTPDELIYFVKTSTGYKVTTDTSGTLGVDYFDTIEAGNVTIEGLEAGWYALVETEAPDGYNPISGNLWVQLTWSATDNTQTVYYKLSTDTNSASTASSTSGYTVQVKNYTGAEIPSTGGIGTTIFYIVGALLMIGAAVVLITRRRMRNEQ